MDNWTEWIYCDVQEESMRGSGLAVTLGRPPAPTPPRTSPVTPWGASPPPSPGKWILDHKTIDLGNYFRGEGR